MLLMVIISLLLDHFIQVFLLQGASLVVHYRYYKETDTHTGKVERLANGIVFICAVCFSYCAFGQPCACMPAV